MFSLGTDCDFALAIASARVGLPVGSPPPVLAATSIDLISLANSLPRRASMTAFLCLVVAHLLWPLIGHPSPSHLAPSRRTSHAPAGRRSAPGGTRSRARARSARPPAAAPPHAPRWRGPRPTILPSRRPARG